MFESIIGTLTKTFDIAPRYLAVVAAFCAFVLFAPTSTIEPLGLVQLKADYRSYLGGALVFSCGLITVSIIYTIAGFFNGKRNADRFEKARLKRLNSLTEDEKQILRFYFANDTRANLLKIDDGVVQGLVSAGIIYRSASLGNMLEGFAHNITDFAWEYINEHPQVLDGTTNTYRTDRYDPWRR